MYKMYKCDIAKHITSIKGIPHHSGSNSEMWLLNFDDGKQGFMKWWLANNSMEDGGLKYEMGVYKNIISPILKCKLSPNFVSYISDGDNCSYSDIEHILETVYPGKDNEEKRRLRLMNSIYHMRRNIIAKRAAITDEKYELSKELDIANEKKYFMEMKKYNFLITQAVPPGTKTLYDFRKDPVSDEEMNIIIFQALAACYVMSLSKIRHNDLHGGNIFVEKLDKEELVTYIYNNKVYTFHSQYRVMIYDFDKTYVESMGNNRSIWDIDFYCFKHSICNEFIENADSIKLMCIIYNYFSTRNVINCLAKDDSLFTSELLGRTFENDKSCAFINPDLPANWVKMGNFYVHTKTGIKMEKNPGFSMLDRYSELNDSFTILDKWWELNIGNKYEPNVENLFVAHPDMFYENGIIKDSQEVDFIRSEILLKFLEIYVPKDINEYDLKDEYIILIEKEKFIDFLYQARCINVYQYKDDVYIDDGYERYKSVNRLLFFEYMKNHIYRLEKLVEYKHVFADESDDVIDYSYLENLPENLKKLYLQNDVARVHSVEYMIVEK